ncbi:lysozyme [Altererythrobacter sp. GH1-8]|uniref:lysozyme n=1 Tax=Altererythrobacter sp. GH1-8 TaxID=3349333 RepID=UPI00374D7DD6
MNAPCPSSEPTQRKPIFDKVRELLGRGFRPNEVAILDAALDRIAPGKCPRNVSPAGVALIKRFEGCARLRTDGLVEAYPDPGTGAEPYTIGWGATGPDIDAHTVWSQEQCDARLATDIERHARDVRRVLGQCTTTQAQFDALVSFHYNTGAIGRSTLAEKHKAGDFAGAAEEFQRWNKAGGRVLKGLVRRRAEETKMYRG